MKTAAEKVTRKLMLNELILQLLKIPGNPEVMIERGEWGPSRVKEARLATVEDYDRDTENWEVLYPEVPRDADWDAPRVQVVLIG